MKIQVSITGQAEELNYPLQILHWLLLDLCNVIGEWCDDESIDGVKYPLTAKVTDEGSWLECIVKGED